MLYIVLLLVLVPFITYYITGKRFLRKASSDRREKSPPLIPYLLPGISHSSSLAYQGSRKYFSALLKEYGNFAPFSIRLGFRTFVILREPEHIKKVLSSTSSKYTVHETYKYVFGANRPLLKIISGRGLSEDEQREIEYAQTVLPQKYLTGQPLLSLVDAYVSTLSNSMHDKMFQSGTWTLIEDFWSFYQQVVTKCIVETLFGSAFLKQYRGFVKDLWQFEETIHDFMPGLPRVLQSATHVAPRERLIQGIMRWLGATHSGPDFPQVGDKDPVCDEYLGTKFVQETDVIFAKVESMDIRARAIEMLVIMHSAVSNSAYPGYCAMLEILQRPELASQMRTQIAQHHSSRSGRPDLQGITRVPIVRSIQNEIARLRLVTNIVRHNDGRCQLDEWWTISGGTYAMAFSQDIARNTGLWARNDPTVVAKPLRDFWPERFVATQEKSVQTSLQVSDRSRRSLSRSPSRSRTPPDTLESTLVALLSDDNARLGFELPQTMQAAALLVFLCEFELELCDPEALDLSTTVTSTGYSVGGTRPAVRIRKRA